MGFALNIFILTSVHNYSLRAQQDYFSIAIAKNHFYFTTWHTIWQQFRSHLNAKSIKSITQRIRLLFCSSFSASKSLWNSFRSSSPCIMSIFIRIAGQKENSFEQLIDCPNEHLWRWQKQFLWWKKPRIAQGIRVLEGDPDSVYFRNAQRGENSFYDPPDPLLRTPWSMRHCSQFVSSTCTT